MKKLDVERMEINLDCEVGRGSRMGNAE